jgi:hypothetical protein
MRKKDTMNLSRRLTDSRLVAPRPTGNRPARTGLWRLRRVAAVVAGLAAAAVLLGASPANALTVLSPVGSRGSVVVPTVTGVAGYSPRLSFPAGHVYRSPSYSGAQVLLVNVRIWERRPGGTLGWYVAKQQPFGLTVAPGSWMNLPAWSIAVSPDLYHVDYQIYWLNSAQQLIGYATYDLSLVTEYQCAGQGLVGACVKGYYAGVAALNLA